jgi:excisionase family DNA binding protein
MSEKLDRLMTVSEVAEFLRLSKTQVYGMVSRREIPSIRVSKRRVVIAQSDLVRWIQKQKSMEPSRLIFMIDELLEKDTDGSWK